MHLPLLHINIFLKSCTMPIDALQIINFLNHPTGHAEGEFAAPYVNLAVVDAAGSVPATATPIRETNATAPYRSAELAVGPVVDKAILQHETANLAEPKELVAAVDAFFAEFEFDNL